MNTVTFEKIQNVLSAVALSSGAVALVFAVDSYNLITANDFSPFGFAVMPWLIGVSATVSILAIVAKLVARLRR